jgi:hypothetical protein
MQARNEAFTVFAQSWDDIGFEEMARTLRRHLPAEIAAEAMLVVETSSSAWDGRLPPTAARAPLTARWRDELRAALLRARNGITARLRADLATVDCVTVLAAVAAVGGLHDLRARRQISIPGAFDREIDVMIHALDDGTERTQRRAPTWVEIAEALGLAREVLLIESMIPPSSWDATARVRLRSQVSTYLGATYGPISSDLTIRSLRALRSGGHTTGPALDHFDDDAQATVTAWLRALATVLADVPSLATAETLADAVVQHVSPSHFVDRITLTTADTGAVPVAVLRRSRQRGSDSPALVARGSGAVLVVPRLLITDRHDLFDRLAESLLVQDPAHRGNYSDVRAASLDQMIAESLRRILPGAEVLVNTATSLNGKEYEQDVLAFWDDICICIETKASRIDPLQVGGRTSVPSALRNDVAKGAEQVRRIADALEDGTASVAGRSRHVRRAYRIVATFTTWWGVDTDADALVELGTFRSLDAAMLTSADKFAVYERLFETAEDFVSYLDHRLSYQRRPFLFVADEYELIGHFYTNRSIEPLLPKPGQVMLKDVFQDDVTKTIHASFSGGSFRSPWLVHRSTSLIAAQIERWRRERPPGWLTAYSAVRRMSSEQQRFVTAVLTRPRTAAVAVRIDAVERLTVVVVDDARAMRATDWSNAVRRASSSLTLVVVSRSDQTILAVRGVDDEIPWFAPGVDELVRSRPTKPPGHRPTGQREQPRRRRSRRP